MPSPIYNTTIDQLSRVFDKQLFFVCGVMKSGTTWFERLLDAHKQIICKGEAHFGGNFVRPISELINNYNIEVASKGGAIAHLKEYGGSTDVLSYDPQDTDFLCIAAIGMMFSKWLENENETIKCIGDKTPTNLHDMEGLARLFPSAKFLHIIRDGRDCAVSGWHFNLKTNVGNTIEKWGTFDKFCLDFAEHWSSLILAGQKKADAIGAGKYLEVRYENLIENPNNELSKTLEFLDIETNTDMIQKCIDDCSFSNLSGGRQQGEEDTLSFYRKGISGDWRNYFSDELNESFKTSSQNLLEALGYSD